jgi:hypothetical protein
MDDNDVDALNKVLATLGKHKDQLTFDFDTMNSAAGQPALTISGISGDTIDLSGIGATGSLNSIYDFSYNGASYPSITIGPNTSDLINGTGGYGYAIGGGGSVAGQVLTTGTSGISWSDFNNNVKPSLHVNGDANFDGDVKIKGKSLTDSLEKIEEKLAILRPNEKLEEKWDELRDLRNRYIELEKEIIEKEKMWDILKK